jgi:hypothetical protein
MRMITVLFAIWLLLTPQFAVADSGSGLPVASAIPFDDVDPLAMQAEVLQQIATFLQTVHTHWGEGQDTIRRAVTGHLEREDTGVLVFARRLADHDVLEGYDFRDGSLVQGQYMCLQRPVNGLNEFIDYYAVVKEALTTRYGTPAQDRALWENELYQPLPEYWGVAVQMGHLRYAATWETPAGTISIELTGNHHSRLTIEYRGKAPVIQQQTA